MSFASMVLTMGTGGKARRNCPLSGRGYKRARVGSGAQDFSGDSEESSVSRGGNQIKDK